MSDRAGRVYLGNMDQSDAFAVEQALPDALPASPMPMVRAWLDEATARRVQPNPNAMTLATVDASGRLSARIVLCKLMDVDAGYFVFFTNRLSRKGLALGANSRAALVMHWDGLDRQVRVEGVVTHSPDAESDAYFASRPVESRVAAWASEQSRPVASRDEMLRRVEHAFEKFGLDPANLDRGATVPRPPHWGGYRVWADAIELWVGSRARVHDRARWERELARKDDGYEGSPWRATREQP